MNKLIASPLLLSLAGCAVGPDQSFVSESTAPPDAEVLAGGIAEFVGYRIPSGGKVTLAPMAFEQAADSVTLVLRAEFEHQGLTVVPADKAGANVHRLRYLVTELDGGMLVRVTLDGAATGARYFARNTAGALQPAGPYTVNTAEATR